MRVKIDHQKEVIELDGTGGSLGSTTSVGHIVIELFKNFYSLVDTWEFYFYPEVDGYTFEDGIELKNDSWKKAAEEIVDLMKVKYCDKCGQGSK